MNKAPLGFAPADDVNELFANKVLSSGVPVADALLMGMSPMTSEESSQAGLWPLPALKIPYFDPWKGSPLAAGSRWPDFFRARCLREPVNAPKDFAKYLQPARTGTCAYFPRHPDVDWKTALADPDRMLLITEGELKSAAACLRGYATIGLGGVWNFSSRNNDTSFLPELERVAWARRDVYIIYDADLMANPDVAKAAWRLACELYERGALPHLALLPQEGAKTGLDDFLLAHVDADLDEILRRARQLTAVRPLWELNEKYAAVMEGDTEVVDVATGLKLKDRQLKHRETKRFTEWRLTPNGAVVAEKMSAASAWLDWPLRSTVRRLTFDPKREPLSVLSGDFNTWTGLAIKPTMGDVTPFITLIDHLFTGSEPWIKDWFLNWLAYPLKHVGTKMFTAVILWGLIHGSGKTLVGVTMKKIYGQAFTKIGQRELKSEFNAWAASKTFILGDDITGIDRMDIHDTIKVMITQDTAWINPKGLTPYELDDYANWLFTSNRANAFYLDSGDRRFFVWEVPQGAGKLSREFYIDYMAWLDGDGPSYLLQWLLDRNTSKFDPGDAAPETSSKKKMREEARSDVVNWVEDLASDNSILSADWDLYTSKQLCDIYALALGITADNKLIGQMGRALSAANFQQVYGRRPITGSGIVSARYYAIRNPAKWLKATLPEIQKHLKIKIGKKF